MQWTGTWDTVSAGRICFNHISCMSQVNCGCLLLAPNKNLASWRLQNIKSCHYQKVPGQKSPNQSSEHRNRNLHSDQNISDRP